MEEVVKVVVEIVDEAAIEDEDDDNGALAVVVALVEDNVVDKLEVAEVAEVAVDDCLR